jgi:hypothetical protein
MCTCSVAEVFAIVVMKSLITLGITLQNHKFCTVNGLSTYPTRSVVIETKVTCHTGSRHKNSVTIYQKISNNRLNYRHEENMQETWCGRSRWKWCCVGRRLLFWLAWRWGMSSSSPQIATKLLHLNLCQTSDSWIVWHKSGKKSEYCELLPFMWCMIEKRTTHTSFYLWNLVFSQ